MSTKLEYLIAHPEAALVLGGAAAIKPTFDPGFTRDPGLQIERRTDRWYGWSELSDYIYGRSISNCGTVLQEAISAIHQPVVRQLIDMKLLRPVLRDTWWYRPVVTSHGRRVLRSIDPDAAYVAVKRMVFARLVKRLTYEASRGRQRRYIFRWMRDVGRYHRPSLDDDMRRRFPGISRGTITRHINSLYPLVTPYCEGLYVMLTDYGRELLQYSTDGVRSFRPIAI